MLFRSVDVINTGVDRTLFRPGSADLSPWGGEPPRPLIVQVGNLIERKNPERLARAAQGIGERLGELFRPCLGLDPEGNGKVPGQRDGPAHLVGAGLALATLDMIADAGGRPANFMDIRTTASSVDVAYGFDMLLANPAVREIGRAHV